MNDSITILRAWIEGLIEAKRLYLQEDGGMSVEYLLGYIESAEAFISKIEEK